MHAVHWQPTHNPFDTHGSDRAWFPAGDHDEALSRMLYLVERGCGCGLVRGAHGFGKSRLLREIHQQVRSAATTIIPLNLTGMDRTSFAVLCASGCSAGFDATTASSVAWTYLEDWLRGRAAVHGRVIWLFDDFDVTRESLAPEVLRLGRLAERICARNVLIVAGQRVDDDAALTAFADFTTRLTAWDEFTSREFVTQILTDAGRPADLITDAAWAELLTAAAGNPQRLLRIMEVALVAGGVLESAHITSELITAVADQLGWGSRQAMLSPVD